MTQDVVVDYRLFKELSGKKVILASNSPRRSHLFQKIGCPVEIVPSTFEENFAKSSFDTPTAYCMATARRKAEEVFAQLCATAHMVIAADTIVIFNNQIYEKASNIEEARAFLEAFSGNNVEVVTAVVVLYQNAQGQVCYKEFSDSTLVQLQKLDSGLIDDYLQGGKWVNISGALALQDYAMLLVRGISGDYCNAIGFPMSEFYRHLGHIVKEMN